METGILEQDRNGIVEALLRLCRAVSAVRRYDDALCSTEGASARDGFVPDAGDCGRPNG